MLRATAVCGPRHRVDDGIINQMRKTGRINSRRTVLVCWTHVGISWIGFPPTGPGKAADVSQGIPPKSELLLGKWHKTRLFIYELLGMAINSVLVQLNDAFKALLFFFF